MKSFDMYLNLDLYLKEVALCPEFTAPIPGIPLLSDEFIKAVADALNKAAKYRKSHTHSVRNYFAFKKLVKKLKGLLALPIRIRFFLKKLPSGAYYVHKKSIYFKRPGIYIGILNLGDFDMLIRLFIHELCHFYVSTSEHGGNVFRLTRELRARLGEGVKEGSELFALNPTEYFAMCCERAVSERLIPLVHEPRQLSESLRLEEGRLASAVAEYSKILSDPR